MRYAWFLTVAALVLLLPSPGTAAETVTIAGAGASTVMVQRFCESFAATPEGAAWTFVVPPKSLKHSGGLEWAASGNEAFGRTGRPLDDAERTKYPDLREIPLATLRVGFGVPRDLAVTRLTRAQLEGIWTGKTTNWREVGGPDLPILRLGREPGEAAIRTIATVWPDFARTPFDKVLRKDDEMFQAIATTPGAIGIAMCESMAGQAGILVLAVPDLEVPIPAGLVYLASREDTPLVKAVKAYAASPAWRARCRELDLVPVGTAAK